VKTAVAEVGARALAERVVEGRPASRFKSAVSALAAGTGVAVLVYRLLRSGGSSDSGGRGGDGEQELS